MTTTCAGRRLPGPRSSSAVMVTRHLESITRDRLAAFDSSMNHLHPVISASLIVSGATASAGVHQDLGAPRTFSAGGPHFLAALAARRLAWHPWAREAFRRAAGCANFFLRSPAQRRVWGLPRGSPAWGSARANAPFQPARGPLRLARRGSQMGRPGAANAS